MKILLSISLCLVTFLGFAGNRIQLKKNSGGTSIQINNALNPVTLTNGSTYTIQPGDTVVLSGTYGAINIYNLTQGTTGNEVVFINQGQVIVNGKTGGTPVNFTCTHVKFLFNLDPLYPYGLKVKGTSIDSTISTGVKLLGTPNSDNYEMSGIEIYYAGRGLFENPSTGNDMYNISIHDCYFHDLVGATTSEAIYFGYSFVSGYYDVPRFYNLKIDHCRFENLDGDGAQVKVAEATVSNCYFYNTGKALSPGQGDAVQFGDFTHGKIQNNVFVNCQQHAILHKGTDTNYITNNRFSSIVNTGSTNDIVYINTIADITNSPKLVMYMHNNVFDSITVGRALINNAGNVSDQDTSYYYQNCDTACTWGAANKFLLNAKDKYTACMAPKVININVYGGSNPYSNSSWNNWNIGTATASNITSGTFKYSDGTLSTVTAILSYSKGINDNGSGYTTSLAPDSVIRYTSNSSSPSRTLTINGLSNTKTYSIELYASYKLTTGVDTITHTIFSSGGKADTILTTNNLNDKALLANLVPDSSGKIVITSTRWLGTWTYLNGFKITENTGGSGSRLANIPANAIVKGNNEPLTGKKTFDIYPNPVNDKILLQLNNPSKGALKVTLFDISGKLQKVFSFNKEQTVFKKDIQVNGLARGTYLVVVQIGNYKEAKLIIKQ